QEPGDVALALSRSLSSDPGLERGRAVAYDHVVTVQTGVGFGVIDAEMRASALGAQQRALGDQTGHRMRVLEQPLQAFGGALEARVGPQRLAGRAVGKLEFAGLGGATGGDSGLAERRERGAPAPHEAFAQ